MSSAVMSGAEGVPERTVGSRTASQGVFGGAAIILGIVGLAIATTHPTVPVFLAAIAAIALGLSLIVIGTALSVSYARLLARTDGGGATASYMGGTTIDMFLGGAVVILAILAILGVVNEVLIPVAVIAIGTGLLLNSMATVRLSSLESAAGAQTVARRVVEEMVLATAGVRAVAGVTVIILGILGVIGDVAIPLALVAMIVAGAALLLNSTSLSGRFMGSMIR